MRGDVIMTKIRIILYSMRLQMKQSFVRPMFRFCLLANPIVNTFLLYEMYQKSGAENFMAYVILGAGLMGIWGCICFSSAGDINRERYSGTLSLIFCAPCGFLWVVMGKIMGNTVLSLATLLVSMATAGILFQVPISLASPGYFTIAMLTLIIAFIVISSVISALLTLSRKTELYMNMIELPFILLCGFVYPVDILPKWIQTVSYLFSPTYAIEILRMSVWGVTSTELFWQKCGMAWLITIVNVVLSLLLFKRIDRKVRIAGTLEVA